MNSLLSLYYRLKYDRRGQDMIEYGLILMLISFIVYGWLPGQYTPSLSHIWQRVKDTMCVMTQVCEGS